MLKIRALKSHETHAFQQVLMLTRHTWYFSRWLVLFSLSKANRIWVTYERKKSDSGHLHSVNVAKEREAQRSMSCHSKCKTPTTYIYQMSYHIISYLILSIVLFSSLYKSHLPLLDETNVQSRCVISIPPLLASALLLSLCHSLQEIHHAIRSSLLIDLFKSTVELNKQVHNKHITDWKTTYTHDKM